MYRRASILYILALVLGVGCGEPERGAHKLLGAPITLPPLPSNQCVGIPIAVGDYFWRGGTPVTPWIFSSMRVFWRPGVPEVSYVWTHTNQWIPIRWVLWSRWGGCMDIECMKDVARRLYYRGVRLFEAGNEMDSHYHVDVGAFEEFVRWAREELAGVVIWQSWLRDWREWVEHPKWLEMVDKASVHGLEPQDVEGIPSVLWRSGKLEISTDAQHCHTPPYGCQHVHTAELVAEVMRRLRHEPADVTMELDLWEDGKLGRGSWSQTEWEELVAYFQRGCRP